MDVSKTKNDGVKNSFEELDRFFWGKENIFLKISEFAKQKYVGLGIVPTSEGGRIYDRFVDHGIDLSSYLLEIEVKEKSENKNNKNKPDIKSDEEIREMKDVLCGSVDFLIYKIKTFFGDVLGSSYRHFDKLRDELSKQEHHHKLGELEKQMKFIEKRLEH